MPAIIGKTLTQDVRPDAAAVPAKVPAKMPFLYAVHPLKWKFDDRAGDFVPRLSRIPVDPGVNGCGEDVNRGALAIKAQLEADGWSVIMPGDHKLPGSMREYQHELPHELNKRFVVSAFETAEVIGGDLYREKDEAAEADFVQACLEGGLIQPLPSQIRRKLIRDFAEQVSRLERKAENKPGTSITAQKLKAAKARLKSMQKTLDVKPAAKAEA